MIVYRELSSIEADLGYSTKTLYALSNNISSHYRSVKIPKKNGGTRTLNVPDEVLKKVQSAIAEKLLALEPISAYATAYRPGTNILKNASPHTAKEQILKLDIYNFFDSIHYSTVKDKAFPDNRYSENIRILLSMLCYYKDVLPQGAPTSPVISNIVLCDFDNTVGGFCDSRSVAYTRYCDDMTFSGEPEALNGIIPFVRSELKKCGFILNDKKTKIVSSSKRQSVTGIVVNEKINISDDYKRKIRTEVYFIEKFGIHSHLYKLGYDCDPIRYLNSLLGKINYVLQVCPEDKNFSSYKNSIQKQLHIIKNQL